MIKLFFFSIVVRYLTVLSRKSDKKKKMRSEQKRKLCLILEGFQMAEGIE